MLEKRISIEMTAMSSSTIVSSNVTSAVETTVTTITNNVTTTLSPTNFSATFSKIFSTPPRPTVPVSTTTMPPIATLDYTSADPIITLIIFINVTLTCCLLLCVSYSREVFCFAKPKIHGNRVKVAKKNASEVEENRDEEEEEREDLE